MARRALSLLILLAAEALTVAVLHGLGRVDGLGGPGFDPSGWLRSASPEEVVAGGLRLAALACAWWLVVSTAVYLVASLLRVPGAVRWALLPGARRWVDHAVGASMLASVALGTTGLGTRVASAGEPPPTVEVRDGRAVESIPDPAPPPTAPPAPDPSPVPAEPTVPAPAPPPAPPATHVVVAGDSFWTIAVAHIARVTGRDPATLSDGEITPYWSRLAMVNRHSLRSGNPNLIYPGEILELPPPT